MRVVGIARRQLLDPPACEPRQVGGRTLERREREPAGLVLQRHGDVRPPRERLEQAPLRPAQVLEAVGVDRTAVPGGELVRDPARGVGRAGGRGPRDRAGRAARDSAGRARRGRRRRPRAPTTPLRAPRPPCRARRRIPRIAPTRRARRASHPPRPGAGSASAARRRRPAAQRRSRPRSVRRRRRTSRSIRRGVLPRGRADRARPVRRPTRSARSGQAPAPDRRGNDRGAEPLCRRWPARPATSRPSTHTSPALRRLCLRGRPRNRERARKTGAELGDGTNPSPRLRSGCYGLGLAPAAGGRAPGHARRARIAEICFFCAAPSIGKGQAHRRALSFVHFPAALVTDENGLSCQFDPPSSRVSIRQE